MGFASRLRGYTLGVGATASLLMIAPSVRLAATGARETPTVLLTQGDAPTPAGTPPSSTTPKAGPPAPKNLEPLAPDESTGVLGKKVVGPDGKDLGLVVDVIVAADGHPSAAVIDFGGFLGVGSRKIAVDWRLLRFAPGRPDWQVLLTLGRAEIQAAPEYKPDAATREMVGPPWEAPPSTAVHE
jgi:PRC-barrel domain protein